MKSHYIPVFIISFLCVSFFVVKGWAQTEQQNEFQLNLTRRINAHGDEFNALTLTPDERHLIIGTEKGELLVWNLAEHRVERRYKQDNPIHAMAMLADGHHVVTAGGLHTSDAQSPSVGLWDVEYGVYQEWSGGSDAMFYLLANDARAGHVVGADVKGRIVAWSDRDGSVIASWETARIVSGLAIVGSTIYVASVDRADIDALIRGEEIPASAIHTYDLNEPARAPRLLISENSKRFCQDLIASPDGKFIAVVYQNEERDHRVVLLDAASGTERASFKGFSMTWCRADQFVLFGYEWPERLIRLRADGKTSSLKFPEGPKWHAAGHPAALTGRAASRDGAKVWGVFRQGAAIVEWRPKKKRAEVLTMTQGSVYAMDVLEDESGNGWLLTGGDDGFARVWNLSDLSLQREFRMPVGVPQGVGLLADRRHAVISYSTGKSPTEILIADIVAGEMRRLLTLERPGVSVFAAGDNFVYGDEHRVVLASPITGLPLREFTTAEPVVCFAVSANGRWLVIGDAKGTLHLFDVAAGREVGRHESALKRVGSLTVSNDGGAVFAIDHPQSLMRWDVKNDDLKSLASVPWCYTIRLSADETRVLFGGHHRDVAIYDAVSGRELLSLSVAAADFYVTNVWARGARLIFTTDAGVMFDGKLVHTP